MHARFGWRAVCIFTSERRLPRRPPELRNPELVAASYYVPPERLTVFCDYLKQHHPIATVVPHGELEVEAAAEIAEVMDLGIWPRDVVSRFRDKASLKAYLAEVDPGIRLNFAQTVVAPKDALALARENQLSRFVIKPNDGFGNIDIGFFDGDVAGSLLEAHWARNPDTSWLMESYIEGDEYHCNGQVDAEGNITILDVGQRHNIETHDRGVICTRTDQTLTTNLVFKQIADYTRRVITASGLRRLPFHAEFRVDADGPVLLECGARLMGGAWANIQSAMHSPACDPFDLAAHYYGSAEPYGEPGIDWNHYDSQLFVEVRGVCRSPVTVYSLSGFREIEAWPSFHRWTKKPYIAQRLSPTDSLPNSPYAIILRVRTAAEVDALEARVRAILKWNEAVPTLKQRLALVRHGVGSRIRGLMLKGARFGRASLMREI